jgi:hypothetical protein
MPEMSTEMSGLGITSRGAQWCWHGFNYILASLWGRKIGLIEEEVIQFLYFKMHSMTMQVIQSFHL